MGGEIGTAHLSGIQSKPVCGKLPSIHHLRPLLFSMTVHLAAGLDSLGRRR